MMFAHVPEHIEPGHRLHFDVSDHDLRRDAVELLDRFGCRIEWENLMSLFAAESHDDLHHCGFVIDNYDFSHGKSQRGEYFSFEKKKAVLRIVPHITPLPAKRGGADQTDPLDRK